MYLRRVLGLVPLFGLAACSGNQTSETKEVGSTGMRLVASTEASDDVAGMRFSYQPVDCDSGEDAGEAIVVERGLEPITIPAAIPELEDAPFDAESEHLFADNFELVEPGCYDVTASPITEDGDAAEFCYPATISGVEAIEGETTEVLLINQCRGTDNAAIDAIAVLNHEPDIVDVDFEESKFRTCGQPQQICASVVDPDNDPVEFEWTLTGGPAASGPTVISRSHDSETFTTTECVEYLPTGPGRYDVHVTVYDLVHDGGGWAHIEDVTEEGYESHADLDFFFYVGVPDEEAADEAAPVEEEAAVAVGGLAAAVAAPTLNRVLILASTVAGGMASNEAVAATNLGLGVDLVSDAAWGAMTLADFSQYRALVLGDPNCIVTPPAAAAANAMVWGAAATGNVMIVGSDPALHSKQLVADAGVAFAVDDASATGAYVTTSCYYHSAPAGTPIPMLDGLGTFTAVNAGACHNSSHIVAAHPAMASLSDAYLSNWSCSVHNSFDTWPGNFEVLAISLGFGSEYEAGDGTIGTPYILARGVIPANCGNGEIDPGEGCDDGNNEDGDGCDAACNLEICGDGVVQGGEECDDGNEEDGDGCDHHCRIEIDPCATDGE